MRIIGTPNIPGVVNSTVDTRTGVFALTWDPPNANVTTIARPLLEGMVDEINRLRTATGSDGAA